MMGTNWYYSQLYNVCFVLKNPADGFASLYITFNFQKDNNLSQGGSTRFPSMTLKSCSFLASCFKLKIKVYLSNDGKAIANFGPAVAIGKKNLALMLMYLNFVFTPCALYNRL